MPVKLLSETSQSLNPGAFIFLYTLDCSSLGGPILRWANCCEEDGSPVQFGGIEYPPMNFAAEGFTWEGDTLPRPKITTSVADDAGEIPQRMLDLIFGYKGGQGATLYRIRTLDRYLDGHEDGGESIAYPSDVFLVDRVSVNKMNAVWELLAPLDLPNLKLPSRQILRDACPWIYRHWDSGAGRFVYDTSDMACPYAGERCYTKTGAVADESGDVCGHRLSDCVLRFGEGNPLYYGGFPGVARTRA